MRGAERFFLNATHRRCLVAAVMLHMLGAYLLGWQKDASATPAKVMLAQGDAVTLCYMASEPTATAIAPAEMPEEKTPLMEEAKTEVTTPVHKTTPQTISSPERQGVRTPAQVSSPVQATYPRQSILRREEGVVVLRVRVSATGRAESVQVLEGTGFARLDRAAVEALRRAKFSPAMRDGVAVATEMSYQYRFCLQEAGNTTGPRIIRPDAQNSRSTVSMR